jgi:hypothetical protein
MRSVIAAIGIWLVFVLVFASLVGAQGSQSPAPGSKPPAVATTEVSGDSAPRGRDPESVGVSPADLKPGANVKASVEERGGQTVVTSIRIN